MRSWLRSTIEFTIVMTLIALLLTTVLVGFSAVVFVCFCLYVKERLSHRATTVWNKAARRSIGPGEV